MKIATVVGARPQFIKATAVSRAIKARAGSLTELLVHTGQHYDAALSDVFFRELGLQRPNHSLGVGGGSHGEMTGRMLEKLDALFAAERPDMVLVYGDTNSTLAGALAAAKLRIPIAHVEAGLRSFNRAMPEEINRVLTDHCSDLLFCPTRASVDNLKREGIERGVHLVGDVMYDVALHFGGVAESSSNVLTRFGLRSKTYLLATVHRAENTDDPGRLANIVNALEAIARHTEVLLPLHPRTRKMLARQGRTGTRLRLVDPVGFFDMLVLEKNARAIATDSGGVQKEAYFYRVPCVTLRDETEWVELVEAGANRLAPPTASEPVAAALGAALQAGPIATQAADLYGDGRAAQRIVELIGAA